MRINLPKDVIKHEDEHRLAYLIQADGFQKLIGYFTDKCNWVHKNYIVKSRKKKNKK